MSLSISPSPVVGQYEVYLVHGELRQLRVLCPGHGARHADAARGLAARRQQWEPALDVGDAAVGELEAGEDRDGGRGEGEEGGGARLLAAERHGAEQRALHADVRHEVVVPVPDADADRDPAAAGLLRHQPDHLLGVVPRQVGQRRPLQSVHATPRYE